MRPLASALAALALAGCGGGEPEEAAATAPEPRCQPGLHELVLPNGQAATMRVTPDAGGARALLVVLHGAGGSPASALDAFRGGTDEPGLVLIAPQAKGPTWSILASDEDVDLESVNQALAEAGERCALDRMRIGLGGFSDGATYALSLAVSNGDVFPAAIAFSPGGIVSVEQVGAPRIFVSHGTLDDVIPIARGGDAVVRNLRQAEYDVTYERFDGGHEVPEALSAQAVRWFLGGA